MIKEMSFLSRDHLSQLLRAQSFRISTCGSNDSVFNKLFLLSGSCEGSGTQDPESESQV